MELTFSESYCQILQTFFTEDVPQNTSFSLRCEHNIVYWCDIYYFCYDYKHQPLSEKP